MSRTGLMLSAMTTQRWADARVRELTYGRVLDVGCGDGRFLPSKGVGIDIDQARLRLAQHRSRMLAVADARRLPFADGTFDTAYANRMLNDTGATDDVLREVRRVLRPGGRLIVYTRARSADGDRLDASNGHDRLRAHFSKVRMLRDPEDAQGAIFVAEGSGDERDRDTRER